MERERFIKISENIDIFVKKNGKQLILSMYKLKNKRCNLLFQSKDNKTKTILFTLLKLIFQQTFSEVHYTFIVIITSAYVFITVQRIIKLKWLPRQLPENKYLPSSNSKMLIK